MDHVVQIQSVTQEGAEHDREIELDLEVAPPLQQHTISVPAKSSSKDADLGAKSSDIELIHQLYVNALDDLLRYTCMCTQYMHEHWFKHAYVRQMQDNIQRDQSDPRKDTAPGQATAMLPEVRISVRIVWTANVISGPRPMPLSTMHAVFGSPVPQKWMISGRMAANFPG